MTHAHNVVELAKLH